MVVAVVAAGLVILCMAAVLGMRRYALRVEHGTADLPDKVHRLQRGLLVALLVPALLQVLSLALRVVHLRTSGTRHDPLDAVLAAAPLLAVTLVVALLKAVRPSLVRLRGIEGRLPDRLRRLLALVPLLVVAGVLFAALKALAPGSGPAHVLGVVLAYAVVLGLVQVLLPPLLLVALRARPLDPAQEQRLDALAGRLGVRLHGFRSVPGRSQKVANALQVGVLPRLRYVLLTDYLLDNMTPEQVDGVVAHELGHAKDHHLLLKLVGAVGVVVAFAGLLAAVPHRGDRPGLLLLLLPLALPVALLLVQGLVGVRLEKAADAYAVRELGPTDLATALERLAELNHTPRRTGRFWNLLTQHPGLQERIDALQPDGATRR